MSYNRNSWYSWEKPAPSRKPKRRTAQEWARIKDERVQVEEQAASSYKERANKYNERRWAQYMNEYMAFC